MGCCTQTICFREAVTGVSAGAFDGVSGPRGLSDRLFFVGTGGDSTLEFMLCASYMDLEEKTKNSLIGMCTKGRKYIDEINEINVQNVK